MTQGNRQWLAEVTSALRDDADSRDPSRYNAGMTDLKPRSNRAVYLRALRAMSPQARLRRAFELSDLSVALFRAGMARRFPNLSLAELERRVRERLDRCHNRNY